MIQSRLPMWACAHPNGKYNAQAGGGGLDYDIQQEGLDYDIRQGGARLRY